MRSTLFLAPLLAAITTTRAQHVKLEIPEVDEYVHSMLGEFDQYVARLDLRNMN